MQCVECGAPVPPRATHCPRCGAPIPQTEPTLPTAATRPAAQSGPFGVPADRYVPSQYGPPVLAERSPYTLSRPAEVPRVRRPIGYRPIVPPPPPPPHRQGGCLRVALVCAILVALSVLAITVVSGHAGSWQIGPFGPFGVHTSFVPTSTPARPRATVVPACASPHVDALAATRLSHVQMTTGLENIGSQDYHPRDNVTTFHAGHVAYITFELATASPGTVGVTFCTPGGDTVGTLRVPAGSTGRYGEFSTALETADVGAGVATLTWNGSVAAVVRFTVTP